MWSNTLCRQATHAYILIMVSLFPLFTGADGYIMLTEDKFAFFSIVSLLWLLLILCGVLREMIGGKRLGMDRVDAAVILFMLACVISTILSPYASFLSVNTGRCDGLLTYLLYCAIFCGVSHYGRPRRIYLYALAASYSVCCAITILQLLGYNPLALYPGNMNYYDSFIQENGRFLGTLGNEDVFSAFHCLVLPLICAYCVFCEDKNRYWLLVPAVCGIACAVSAGVSSGILALSITALITLPLITKRLFMNLTPRFLGRMGFVGGAAVSVFAAAVFMVAVLFGDWESGTVYELQCLMKGELSDGFGSGRVGIWKKTFDVIRQNILFGVGPDSLAYPLSMQFERFSEESGMLLTASVDNAHNEYLQAVASFGLAGTVPAAIAYAQVIHNFFQIKNNGNEKLCLCIAIVCYLIQAFFNIGLCLVTPIFIIAMALLEALYIDQHWGQEAV